jgi:hypothetical protein
MEAVFMQAAITVANNSKIHSQQTMLARLEITKPQSINQLHVFLAREEPKKGATPKPP